MFAPATGAFADEAPQDASPAVSAEAQQPQQAPQADGTAPAQDPAPAPAPAEQPAAPAPAPAETPSSETPQAANAAAEVRGSVRILAVAKQAEARVALVGDELEAQDVLSTPSGVTADAAFTWFVDDVEVATGTRYTVRAEDLGKAITVSAAVEWPASEAFAAGKTSVRTAEGVVVKQRATVAALSTLSGPATVGSRLVAGSTKLSAPIGVAPWTGSYTWYVDGIQAGTGTFYTVKPADAGKRITVGATLAWADTGNYVAGNAVVTRSAATAPVAKVGASVVPTLRVNGYAQVGKSLRASVSVKKPSDLAVSGSYMWYVNGKKYGGGALLNVTPFMAGKRVTVVYQANWGSAKYASGSSSKQSSYVARVDRPTAMVRSAYAQLGARQDCTALIERALRSSGTRVGDLGTRASEYAGVGGKRVSSLKPGDVMVWEGRHVAMYIGNGKAIHSGYAGNQTVVASAYLDGNPSSILRFA